MATTPDPGSAAQRRFLRNLRELERLEGITCPHCGQVMGEEVRLDCTSYHGDTYELDCTECGGEFTVVETVTRTFECEPIEEEEEDAPSVP